MHASPARVPKRRAKAQKPANPWLALPRLAALFDHSTQQNFFKGSKVPELEELALTETQLLEQTAALLGVSLTQLVRAGALVYAKREFLGHKKYLSPPLPPPRAIPLRLLCSGRALASPALPTPVSRPLLTPW
jgi:hypothetical protein